MVMHNSADMLRACYQDGLQRRAALSGRVTVQFTIDKNGKVKNAKDAGSTMPDKSVVKCVVKGIASIEFPAPESGMADVVYPIDFGAPDAGS